MGKSPRSFGQGQTPMPVKDDPLASAIDHHFANDQPDALPTPGLRDRVLSDFDLYTDARAQQSERPAGAPWAGVHQWVQNMTGLSPATAFAGAFCAIILGASSALNMPLSLGQMQGVERASLPETVLLAELAAIETEAGMAGEPADVILSNPLPKGGQR
ncbi:MAG: hypothetical protein AAGL18_03060 [Pseudomonadota bacterium]